MIPSQIDPIPQVCSLCIHDAHDESIFLSNTDQNSCCDIAGLPALTLFAAKPAFLLDVITVAYTFCESSS